MVLLCSFQAFNRKRKNCLFANTPRGAKASAIIEGNIDDVDYRVIPLGNMNLEYMCIVFANYLKICAKYVLTNPI